MSLAILGLGTALPESELSAEQSVEAARRICRPRDDQAEMLGNLYRQTGIRRRHLAFSPAVIGDLLQGTRHTDSAFLPRETNGTPDPGPTTAQRMAHYDREARPLALGAARAALAEADIDRRAVTHLVTVSCTGFQAPGVDIHLLQALELRPTVERTHVGFMGCHGALNGLRVARAYADADPRSCVLLCAVELCGLHYHYPWDPKRMVANALFADGAAAAIGRPAQDYGPGTWRVTASGSCVFAGTEDAMTWGIGDHGFEMTLSTRVPELIRNNLRPWLETWLEANGLTCADVPTWAVHPGGPRILRAVEEALGLTPDTTAVSQEVLAECGNMSSPTLLFILERLRRNTAPRPCVALGFGPGLTVEATLFT